MGVLDNVSRTIRSRAWWLVVVMTAMMAVEVVSLNGPNVCIVKQKYNITKRVKYRAPMAVRTYVWCFAVPPRCSRWSTEMKDLTRLETEERVAEMSVCCPGYKLKHVSCVPICPDGKTGNGCTEECPPMKWGPNCVHECKGCEHGNCSPTSGECQCQEGWQGESCEVMSTTPAVMGQLLTTANTTATTKNTTLPITKSFSTTSSSRTEINPNTMTTTFLSNTEASTLSTPIVATTVMSDVSRKSTVINTANPITFTNTTTTTLSINHRHLEEKAIKKLDVNNAIYNRTEVPIETTRPALIPTITPIVERTITTTNKPIDTTAVTTVTTELATTFKETTTKLETTRKLEVTVRQPTTVKFKPKEIWIRPAQKGESTLFESKVKQNPELPHLKQKIATKKELTEDNTTPKTIIVSIIPTSVSYATFKKLALSTTSYTSQKNNITIGTPSKTTDQGYTKPMTIQTTSAPFIKLVNAMPGKANTSRNIDPLLQNITKAQTYSSFPTKEPFIPIVSTNRITNSMSSTLYAVDKGLNSSNLLTTVSVSSTNVSTRRQTAIATATSKPMSTSLKSKTIQPPVTVTTEQSSIVRQFVTVTQRNVTVEPMTDNVTNMYKVTKPFIKEKTDTNESKDNVTNTNVKTNTVTNDPTQDEETFHILTEPEHITAVMGDKGNDRTSVDLISVISIAGGVMMAMITVAVVIVMVERCKRPRYEDVRKFNDIRMQVMIDKNDVPPPYVRSIFHTPLPEPPTLEKCHYQPISTLDRNLKQFMRPVVVQTISPLMLENFRGILECHYDHLPRRSQDLGTMQFRQSVAPSMAECEELLQQRVHSLTDSDIEAMKCEAKQDVIDNTTSEPLYAEIPCWRPPSEHAIEIVNLNGEAVTEL